ncbi:MAG: phospholipase D family protein [Cyclobacteriaceae bacterium]
MAKFLTTYQVTSELESIIINSSEFLVLVTPFVDFPKTLFERVISASNRGVKITLIYGKSELTNSQKELVMRVGQLEVFYLDNLHAKCYYNESKLIITSMNLYDYSAKNNREMGVLIDSIEDSALYKEAVLEAQDIKGFATAIKRISDSIGSEDRKIENQVSNFEEDSIFNENLLRFEDSSFINRIQVFSKTPYYGIKYLKAYWLKLDEKDFHLRFYFNKKGFLQYVDHYKDGEVFEEETVDLKSSTLYYLFISVINVIHGRFDIHTYHIDWQTSISDVLSWQEREELLEYFESEFGITIPYKNCVNFSQLLNNMRQAML